MNTTKGIFPLTFTIMIMRSISPELTQANEFAQLVNQSTKPQQKSKQTSLPMDVILDNQGKPISLPAEQSALDYSANEMRLDESIYQSSPARVTYKRNDLRISKQKMAKKTINDPSCRWLGQRMKQLKIQLKRNKAEHIETELTHRQEEWDCLHCSTTGPTQAQYSQCQYRR